MTSTPAPAELGSTPQPPVLQPTTARSTAASTPASTATPDSSPDSSPSPPPTPACMRCGRDAEVDIADVWLCFDCYHIAGSTCAGLGRMATPAASPSTGTLGTLEPDLPGPAATGSDAASPDPPDTAVC